MENKSVFGCPEVQQRCDSAKGECGDNVCQVKRTLTKDTVCIVRKDGTVKQSCVAKCANVENKKTSPNLFTLPKKQSKNEEDLIQKLKTTSHKNEDKLTQKMKTTSPNPKIADDSPKKGRQPYQKN